MTIVIIGLGNVEVDGVPSGSVVDVLSNSKDTPQLRADFYDALIAREFSFQQTIKDLQNQNAQDANVYLQQIADLKAAADKIALQIEDAVKQGDATLLAQAVEDAKDPVIAKRKAELLAKIEEFNKLEATLQAEYDSL